MALSRWTSGLVLTICLSVAACGGHGKKDAGDVPTSGTNGGVTGTSSTDPGGNGQGNNQPEAHGAPYEVPNYGANVYGMNLADSDNWAAIQQWFWSFCPADHPQCVELVKQFQAYRDHPEGGCIFREYSPGPGQRIEFGKTITVWGSAPCSSGPSPGDSVDPGTSPDIGDSSPPSAP